MFSYLLESAIKPEENYEFFVYTGNEPVEVEFRGKTVQVKKGDRFGVRRSSNGKQIRMVIPEWGGLTKVITLSLDQAKKLAKKVKGG